MFNRILDSLTLSGDLADSIFRNIRGHEFNGDESFIATLRALLHPRIDAGAKVRLHHSYNSYRGVNREGHNARELVEAGIGSIDGGYLYVHDVHATASEDRKEFFDVLDDAERGFLAKFPNFSEMTNIREFVAPQMNARFYTSEALKTTVIFVDFLNTRKWHYIQSFIPRYFKWYFEAAPITEQEKNLLASLLKRSSDDYEAIIERIAEGFDMRSHLIDSMIGDLERSARAEQLDHIDHQISEARNKIEGYMNQYREVLSTLDDLNIRRIGLLDIIDSATGDSELADYLKSNKNIDVLGASGSTFEFVVHTYLDYWSQEIFDSMVNRPNSNLYTSYGVGLEAFSDVETRKKFLSAIFSDDPLLRIKMCGYYRLDIRGDSTSRSGYTYPRNCADRMPNPHLQRFNCLGNHQVAINEYLRNGDTVGAVEQCVGSCKSVNLAESPTFSWFFEKLFATNAKVIELPDHTSVSPLDALNWLNERDAASTEV